MARPVLALLCLLVAAAALLTDARQLQDSGTTSNSDRVQLALSGARDAISAAVNSGANLMSSKAAASNSLAFARLAGKLSARGSDFNRRLQDSGTTSNSDRVQLALSGAQDAIAAAVNSGANLMTSKAAASNSLSFARLAGKLSAHGSDFNRRLHFHGGNSAGRPVNQGTSFYVEGDRNAASQAAASEAITQAARGDLKATLATSVGSKAAYMSTRRSAGLKTFDSLSGRRLQDSGTTSNSDRVQLALSGAQDAIAAAVNSGANLMTSKAAASNSLSFARLAGKLSARGSDFSSP